MMGNHMEIKVIGMADGNWRIQSTAKYWLT
jgi:hypothetical protein